MATEHEVMEIFRLLRLNFPEWEKKRSPSDIKAAVAMYQNRLAPIDGACLREVAMRVIDENPFFPRVSELRKPAIELMRSKKHQAPVQALIESRRTQPEPHAKGLRKFQAMKAELAKKLDAQRMAA